MYLRRVTATLPNYNTEGQGWHCVLCQQDYYAHKSCEICDTGIYSIEDESKELPEIRLRPRFTLVQELVSIDAPDIPGGLRFSKR